VANKVINIKQCTILCHVDKLKISHMDKEVVEGIIERGKILEYQGMTLDYTKKVQVKISMHK